MSKAEGVIVSILSMFKHDISDYCDIETVDGNSALVFQDGSYASILKFNGSRSIIGRDQYERMLMSLTRGLAPFMSTRGHMMQFYYKKDLDASESLNRIADLQKATAGRLAMQINDLIDENVERMGLYVYDEECYIVLWSRPALLDPIEAKIAQEQINDLRKEAEYPSAKGAQNLLRPISFLRDRHFAFVGKVADEMRSGELGCSVRTLDLQEALCAVRRSVLPDVTSHNWEPDLAPTGFTLRWKNNDDWNDASELLPASLPQQIMAAGATIGSKKEKNSLDPTMVRVGSRLFAPIMVDRPPNSMTYFNSLFNALNRVETTQNGVIRSLPYSVSFFIEGDGLSGAAMQSILSSLLSFTSAINKNIKLAREGMSEYARDNLPTCKIGMSAMTWAEASEAGLKELALRKSKLWRTIESWSGAKVADQTGNPMLSFQTNALALSPKRICNNVPAPLYDALSLMPLSRPASPFDNGSIFFRSKDGKLLTYERFSSEQTTWITLISGKPGSGKSVLMNNNNLEACLLPGMTQLPYMCTLDIGISSRGPVDLIRDALPEQHKHLAVYKRLQNTANDCINPFDTSLGMRHPLPKDREFLRNFITLMTTPPERRGLAYEGMSAFVGRVIDLAYRMRSDGYEGAQPETYKPGHDEVIDRAVGALGFHIREATTYWQLVDGFFQCGYIYEAELAQRYAVPTLDNLVQVARSEAIVEDYGTAMTNSGRSLIDTFCTGVREAISEYPIFSGQTRFDLGPARVVALDLTDVAPTGSDAAVKQTALMYMIGRQAFMKKIAFSMEDMPLIPELFRGYYEEMIKNLIDAQKIYCMDEYHKTGNNPSLVNQVMTDGREARKWNLEIILASQLMEDFGELTKIATTKFILDAGNEQTRDWLRTNIGLSETEESALVANVKGPGQDGATFLAQISTKSASFSQLFTMTIGPMRLWALSTTAEDRKMRNILYESFSPPIARAILAEQFPSGSCKKQVERARQQYAAGRDFVNEDENESVIERMANDIIHQYRHLAA